jgi:hypothetical protein
MTPAQRAAFEDDLRRLDSTLQSWAVAAEAKADQELRMRLNLWQSFWADCDEEPRNCADHYPHEVSQRAIAELLLRELPRLRASDNARALPALDRAARARLTGDAFVWDPALQPAFPHDDFWFLYGRPRPQKAA